VKARLKNLALPHAWAAKFDDVRHRVTLCKQVRGSSGQMRKTLTVEYRPPFLRRIDPISGMVCGDNFSQLPPESKTALMAACAERWT